MMKTLKTGKQYPLHECITKSRKRFIKPWLIFFSLLLSVNAYGQTLISITNPPAAVTASAVGNTQFWPNAGTVNGTPISLRATLTSISAGDTILFFTSGDNPVVRANTGTLSSTVLWEVFNTATGAPIIADPNFLITDIDGSNGNPIESVSAACAGLTSYTVNGPFLAGCNANTNGACASNIRVSESGGNILAEGTQNQNGNQQEGYMQYSWNGVSSWVVNYFATSGGRWYVHDADGDIPFDGTKVDINLVDMATIKGVTATSLTSPAQGELITFQIDMSNSGPEAATGANLNDLLPAGLSYVSHTASSGAYNPATGAWSAVNVAVGNTETLTITALVTAVAGTAITNITTTALAAESICSSRDLLEYPFIVAETPAPSMTVVKSVSPVTTFNKAGDTITYSYEVANTGNVNIDNVVPTDSGPTFGGLAATNALVGFSPVSATITPGNSQVFTATYLLDQADVDNMAQDANPTLGIDNTASATGVPTGGMLPVVPNSIVETGFNPMPSLSIVKAVSGVTVFDKAGDTITYQYTVDNNGNITIEDVSPTDSGPTFNGVAATGTLSAFSPLMADIEPGSNEVFTATYVLQQADVDNMSAAVDPLTAIDNTAGATGDPVGATALPAVTESVAETGFMPAPSMTIAKSVGSATTFSQAGDTITYEYLLDNTGNVTINNAVPTDSGPTFNGIAGTNSLSAFLPPSATIAPSDSPVMFTATYVLSQTDVDNMFLSATPATAIDNMASATGTPIGGTLPVVPNSIAQTGFAVDASLSLAKSAGTPSIGLGSNAAATDAGDTIIFSFDVTNSGDVSIDSLVINDSGPTFNSVAGSGSLSAVNCPLTSLAPAQMTTCTATYTLSQSDVDNAIVGGSGAVENTATASGEDPSNAVVSSLSSMANQTIASDSSIQIVKSAGAPTVANGVDPTLVDPSDTITYLLNVDNTGNTTLSNVLITDSIATVTCPAMTNLGAAFVNDGSAQLAVGDGIVCSAVYSLLQTDLDNGGVQNTANVVSTDPNSVATNDSDTVNSGFTQKTSVSLVKSATPLPASPVANVSTITYAFELTNTGNVTLTSPQVVDPICSSPVSPLTFASGYTSGDAAVSGQMEAGETWLFNCDYTISQADINAGEVANTAVGSGTPPPGSGLPNPENTASNLADAGQNAAISLDKSSSLATVSAGTLSGSTDIGDTVSYRFDVENTGNVTLTNIVVTDPLITGAPNNGTISCPAGISSMAPGATVTCTASYNVTQTNIDAGMIANTASVTGTPPVTVPPIDAPTAISSNTVAIAPAPDLMVTKSVGTLTGPLTVGTTVNYSFLIENIGNVTINTVVPVDSGPTFNGASGAGVLSAFSPASANLSPNTSAMFTATYALTQADIDNIAAAADPLTAIDNSATADGAPENGSLPPIDPSSTETGAALNPQVELLKSSTPPPSLIVAGSDITYNFELRNSGNVTIMSPVVTDARCAMPGSVLNFASGYVSGDTGATIQALDVGETWVFSCTYPISQADINAGTVQNTATGGGQDPSGNNVEDDSDSSNTGDDTGANNDPTNTTLGQVSSWTVVKSTVSTPSIAGDTLTYQFVVDNTGNVDISSVSVVDAKCAATPMLVNGDIGSDLVLSPPEIWTFECTSIGVTQAEVDNGMVDNDVDVLGAAPSSAPPLTTAEDDESTPIAPMPNLTVDKTAGTPTIGLGLISDATDPGDTISYTFSVLNNGNVTVSAITVNDSGPTFGGLAGVGAWSGVSCSSTTLLPLQSTSCNATYTLTQLDIDRAIAAGASSVENSATVQGQDPDLVVITSVADTDSTTIVADSELQVLKIAGAPTTIDGSDPALTDPGDTIDFTITVENTGNTTLSSVLIADNLIVLPNSLTCDATASPSGAPFINDGSANLTVGDSVECLATYPIDQDDINAGQVINTASVTSQDPFGDPVGGVAEATSAFTQKTSVSLLKTASVLPTMPPPLAGDLITYTFELENTGNVSLSDALINDTQCEIPVAPLTSTNGLLSATDIGGDGLLDAGEVWTFECDYALKPGDIIAGEITNTATGTGTPPLLSGLDAPTATSSALVSAEQSAAITLDKVAGLPTVSGGTNSMLSDVGDTITFSFNIRNTGNLPFETVSLSDPLITDAPNSGTFTCVLNDGVMTPFVLNADPLPSLDDITCAGVYTLTQADVDAGVVANMATAIGDPPGVIPPAPEAVSGSTAPVPPAPSMTILKSASVIPVTVMEGTVITYTYLVENTGNVTISNVAPIDLGPTFNGVTGTNILSGYTPIVAILAPGDSQPFQATYAISQIDLDNMAAASDPATAIVNEATTDGEPAQGSIPPVPPSTVETGVVADPKIELVKTSVSPAIVTAGADIVYTFMLSNIGNVSVSDPIVNDSRCMSPGTVLSFTSGYVSGDTGIQPEVLDVGETWEFSCTYAISQADINAGTVQNSATAEGQDPSGATISDDSDSNNPGDDTGAADDPTNSPLMQNSAWNVMKSTVSVPSVEGDTLVYQFVVENLGNVDITSVLVSDMKCAAAPVLLSGDVGADLILSPSENWIYECTSIGVTQTEVNDGMVDNEVTITGTAPPSAPVLPSDSHDISTPIAPAPGLTIDKSASPPTIGLGNIGTATDVGDTIVYSFDVENTGNVTISSITVVDTGPTFGGNIGTGVWTGTSCSLASLLPMQSTLCGATYTLSQADIDAAIAAGPNSVVNSANADGLTPNSSTTPSLPDEEMTTISADSAVSILKIGNDPTILMGADPVLTDPGDMVTYDITVQNTGNTTLSNVLVTDTLTAVTCSLPASPSGNPFTNNGTNNLAVGDSVVCTATYTINQNDINNGQVLNTANVSSVDPAGTPVNGSAQETTAFTQKTSLALVKTASMLPVVPAAGDIITYSFMVENTGNVTLSGVQVDDMQCQTPIAPLTAVNGLNAITDTNSDQLLDAGEIWTFECGYAITTADILASEIINTASATGSPPAGSGLSAPSSSSSALVKAAQNAAITLDKVAGMPTITGGLLAAITDAADTVPFTFNIANTGNLPFDTVSLSDPLITGPPNSALITCVLNDGMSTVFNLNSSPLPVGEDITCSGVYTLTQNDVDTGSLSNVATAAGDPPGTIPPSPEGTSGSMVPITPEPSMTVMKSASAVSMPEMAGSVITYTYVVENTGNVTINNVVPVDLGPVFNGVAGTNSLSAYAPTTVTLAPGANQSFEATYIVSQQDLDNMAAAAASAVAIVNQASANGDPVNGSLPTVPSSEAITGFEPTPALALIKTSSITPPVSAGSLVNYTFMLSNVGNVTIDNPIVTDARCQSPSNILSFSSGYVSGDTGTITQSLDVGETWEFACVYAISQTDMDAGTIQNMAVGSGQAPDGSSVSDDSDSGNAGDDTGGGSDPTNTALPRTPNWMVEKSTTSVPMTVGDTLNYRFVVTNLGNTSISAVTVNDAKCVGGTATLDVATDVGSDNVLSPTSASGVPAAEQWTYNCVSIAVTQSEINSGVVINDVTVTGTAPGGGLADADDRLVTPATQTPLMSLVKSAGIATINEDGSFDQSFNFELRNVGNVVLTNVDIADDLNGQFGSCFDSVIENGVASIIDVAPTAGLTASSAVTLPSIAQAPVLGVGDSVQLTNFIVRFNPNASGCTFPDPASNSATATADSPTGSISDVSDSGTDPASSTPNNSGVTTPFTIPNSSPELGVAKSAAILAFNDDFTFDVEFRIQLQNTGDVNVSNLSLFDDISGQFGLAFTPSSASNQTSGILSSPVVSLVNDSGVANAVLPNVSSNYQGNNTNLFDGTSGLLGVGDIIDVVFSLRVDPSQIQPLPLQFENIASASAASPDGTLASDLSNSGDNPNLGSGGTGSPTIVSLDDVANLPIVLGEFRSNRNADDRVVINWKTQTEVANLGFNVYGRINDEWVLLNKDIISAKGDSVEIVSYSLIASTAANSLALSDIDGNGKETLHGPFLVGSSYGKASQRQSTDWSKAIERRELKSKTRMQQRRQEMMLRNQRRQQKSSVSGGQ